MNDLVVSDNIKNKIHTIRGVQVMMDNDLADLYGVLTGNLNKAVKRNIERFPEDFMFQITKKEYENLIFSNETSSYDIDSLRFQNGTLETNRGKHRKYLPFVFTEQGVAILSGVLKSKKAIEMNILIMRAFVSMRKFISQNANVFARLESVEKIQIGFELKTDDNFDKLFDALQKNEVKQSIFYDGQIFDAYKFVCDLVKKAKEEIVLIDNYVDENVLTLFSKRKKNVSVIIYTKNVSKQLRLDLDKFNSQYENIIVKEFNNSHDRFMIIDEKEVYHFGASLKDLGKKWFAFSKFEKEAVDMLKKLGKNE